MNVLDVAAAIGETPCDDPAADAVKTTVLDNAPRLVPDCDEITAEAETVHVATPATDATLYCDPAAEAVNANDVASDPSDASVC